MPSLCASDELNPAVSPGSVSGFHQPWEKIEYALIAWKSMRDDLASGAISHEEYEDWRASFSE